MQEEIVGWINGLKSNSTEYVNECGQNIFQFSQEPSNLQCFIDIIKENADPYIQNASLHILRSSLNRNYQEIPPELAMELLNNILEEFSKNHDFTMLNIYKSIIKLLILLADEENYPDLLFSFFLQNQNSNNLASIILINIIFKSVEFDESIEDVNRSFFQYSFNFLSQISSFESNEHKAYFLAYTLNNLEQSALLNGEEIFSIDIIEPYIDLFKDSTISTKIYSKLWNSMARIFVHFNQFVSKGEFFILLIKYSSSIPDPAYIYSSIHQFLPFFKEKSIPLNYIKILINCDISVCVRITKGIDSFFFDKEIIKNAIAYYNSPEEINDIYNHIISMIQNEFKTNCIFIVFYGYLIKACNHVVNIDYHDIIQFFDENFNENSNPEYVLASLYSISYITKSSYNNLKEILSYLFDRILACTLTDIPEIRSYSLKIFNSGIFDIDHDDLFKISKSLFENQDKYLQNSPYDFFSLLIVCINYNISIPESYCETCINDILIPLVQEDQGYLKYLSGLICSNEFWIEPFMQLLEPFFDSQIDEEIAIVIDGSFARNNNLESIIDFFSILLNNYDELFFNIAQSYISKLWNLFFKIEDINEELFTFLTNRFSIALKFLTDVEECDKLTDCLFNYVVQKNMSYIQIIHPILSKIIFRNSAEIVSSVISQIMKIIQINENQAEINSCFRILAGSITNPSLNEDQLSEISQFMRKYCTDVVLKEKVYENFFFSLGKMLRHFPDVGDWYQYLFSSIELLNKNKLMLDTFYYACIFKYLLDDTINQSLQLDDPIVELSLQIFNDPNIMNDLKACSTLALSILMEKNRNSTAIQFFKENFEKLVQNLKENDSPFASYSAVIILSAALSINGIEFDPEMLAFCCEKFPDDIRLDVNLLYIKYSTMIMDEENNCVYAPQLELKILDSFFRYLQKPYQRICQIKRGDLYERLVQCFKFLAEKNHDYIQQKIDELADFPSAQKRIVNVLSPPENEQENK